MTSSNAYREQVKLLLGIELDQGDKLQWDFVTVAEAGQSLKDIEATLNKLEALRHEVANDIKAIHDHYREKMENAAARPAAVMKLLGRKQQAGQMVANAKRKLRVRRNEDLVPYNEIKIGLDALILHLQQQSEAAQKFIDAELEDEAGPVDKQQSAPGDAMSLRTFYLDIPEPGSLLALESDPFSVPPPDEPSKASSFYQPKPAEPDWQEAGLGGVFSGRKRQEVEEKNQRLRQTYEQALEEWEARRTAAESELDEARRNYESQLKAWQERRSAYEAGEAARLEELDEARRSDPGTMRSLLGRHLDGLRWPAEVETEFAYDYRVEQGGKLVRLEVCLPEYDRLASALADFQDFNYRELVLAIGLRLSGYVFYVLPGVETVLLNGYTGRSARSSSYADRSYLYSSKIKRQEWRQVAIDGIEGFDVFACFNLFETRREVAGEDRLQPIEPIKV